FAHRKLIGVSIILLGIATMIDNFELAAIVMSFASGGLIVVARTLNALLANVTSLRIGVFYHHLIGTVLSLPILLLLGGSEIAAFHLVPPTHWYIYLGGIFGITVLLIGNIIVMKVSAFYLTLLIFVGQIFTSVIIDMILTQAFSHRNLLGGIIVSVGLCVNLLLDRKHKTT
ncbi:MAG: DMT family transporter, partial [Defluviitaleaceae bacterium]|nr:DMT family transporter [Defluviitaleaceae bacterium]